MDSPSSSVSTQPLEQVLIPQSPAREESPIEPEPLPDFEFPRPEDIPLPKDTDYDGQTSRPPGFLAPQWAIAVHCGAGYHAREREEVHVMCMKR